MKEKTLICKIGPMLLAIFLLLTAGKANAYNMEVKNLPSVVNPGGGSFTFDLFITDLGSLTNLYLWQFQIDIMGRSGQDFVDFDFAATKNTAANANYVFYGDSYQYDSNPFGGNNNAMLGSDLTNSRTGKTGLPALIARVEVDYTASAYGLYDIELGTPAQNFIMDENNNTGNIGTFKGASVAVVPEPVSFILFLSGGSIMALRGLFKRQKRA